MANVNSDIGALGAMGGWCRPPVDTTFDFSEMRLSTHYFDYSACQRIFSYQSEYLAVFRWLLVIDWYVKFLMFVTRLQPAVAWVRQQSCSIGSTLRPGKLQRKVSRISSVWVHVVYHGMFGCSVCQRGRLV